MSKERFVIFVMFISFLLVLPDNTDAYDGGLLEGKPFYHNGNAVYEATDGDLSTYYRYNGVGTFSIELDEPTTLEKYFLKHSTCCSGFSVNFYDADNKLRFSSQYGAGFVTVNTKVPIKSIQIFASWGNGANIYEFDVYGVKPPEDVSKVVTTPYEKSIKLSWENPDNIEKILIYLDGIHIKTLDNTVNEYLIDNLLPDTKYEIKIMTDRNGMRSSGVLIQTKTLEKDETPPAEIRNLQSVVKDTWIRFSWENPTDIDFYEVRIYRNGQEVGIAHTQINYFIDIGLQPHTTYTFVFRSVDTSGNMSAGVSVTETTRGVPRGKTLLYGQEWQNEVTLSWKKNNDADKYNVYQDGIKVAETESTRITIDNLTNGKTYKFYVVPANEFGEGEKSNEISLTPFEIPVPDAPLNVGYVPYNHSITLNWQSVDYARKYNIYAEDAEDVKKIGETTETTYTITELNENTNYTFYVSAENEKGESPRTKVIAKTSSQPIPRDMEVEIKPWDVIYNTIVLIGSLGSIILLSLAIYFMPRIIQLIKQAAS